MKTLYLLVISLALTAATHAQSAVNATGAVNPSSYGPPSNGDATLTTGAISSGGTNLALGSAASFSRGQGIFVGHAGAACGTIRGTPCPRGPVPSLSTVGTPGTTTYSYRVSCLDALGGISPAGPAANITTGNATLSAANSNLLTLTGTAGCIELAIYRNNALIATQYAPPSGTYTFNDTGAKPPTANRDLPLSPPSSALNDNLVATITALSGSTATLSAPAGATVSGTKIYHSDTPLLQAAINTNRPVTGDSNYRINYPINLVSHGGTFTFSALCDTGDLCVDATGQYNLTLDNVSLNSYGTLTAPSSIGLFCARNATNPFSQYLNTTNLYVLVSNPLSAHGAVAFYNYGCEIENHVGINLNGDNWAVLTANNVWSVSSPFDSKQVTGLQSMSQLTFLHPTGGAGGYAFLLENAYTINILSGYFNGGHSTTHPWTIEIIGQAGHLSITGFRTEDREGFIHLAPGAILNEAKIWVDAYRTNATRPQIYLDKSAYIVNSDITVDDYGGSAVNAPLIGGVTACAVTNSTLFVGIHETFDPLGCPGANNVVRNINSGYTNFSGPSIVASGTPNSQQTLANPNLSGAIGVSQLYVPGATSPTTSAYGAGYVFGWAANACGTGLPDFAMTNQADGCVLRYQENTRVLHIGPTDNGLIAGQGFTTGFTGTKTIGACVMTITKGVITNVTGC